MLACCSGRSSKWLLSTPSKRAIASSRISNPQDSGELLVASLQSSGVARSEALMKEFVGEALDATRTLRADGAASVPYKPSSLCISARHSAARSAFPDSDATASQLS